MKSVQIVERKVCSPGGHRDQPIALCPEGVSKLSHPQEWLICYCSLLPEVQTPGLVLTVSGLTGPFIKAFGQSMQLGASLFLAGRVCPRTYAKGLSRRKLDKLVRVLSTYFTYIAFCRHSLSVDIETTAHIFPSERPPVPPVPGVALALGRLMFQLGMYTVAYWMLQQRQHCVQGHQAVVQLFMELYKEHFPCVDKTDTLSLY